MAAALVPAIECQMINSLMPDLQSRATGGHCHGCGAVYRPQGEFNP